MNNPVRIVRESIRRTAGLRHLVRSLPPLVQLAAAVATLAIVAISAMTFLGGLIARDGAGDQSPDKAAVLGDAGGGTDTTAGEASDGLLVVVASNRSWGFEPGYFDIDRLGLSVAKEGSLEYDTREFSEKAKADSDNIRPVGVGEGDIFLTEFTVANTSDRERAIIKAIGVQIEEFEAPPDRLLAGCPIPQGGGTVQQKIEFQVQLNSELIGVEQQVPTVPEPGTVIELGPDNLQAFDARLGFSHPGVHRYRIVVHYDTSGGRSATAASERLEVVLMPSAKSVEGVRPGGLPWYECQPS